MNLCKWCDDPFEGAGPLCPLCSASNLPGPVFRCPNNPGHDGYAPDADGRCVLCPERRAKNEEAIRSLLVSLKGICAEIRTGPKWKGCEFGKAIVGSSFLGALRDLGCSEERIREAMA
jgi:hypothetical protein